MPVLPLSVSGTLPENLEKAKLEATKIEVFPAADKLQAVLAFVRSKQTKVEKDDKAWNDKFLKDTAAVGTNRFGYSVAKCQTILPSVSPHSKFGYWHD